MSNLETETMVIQLSLRQDIHDAGLFHVTRPDGSIHKYKVGTYKRNDNYTRGSARKKLMYNFRQMKRSRVELKIVWTSMTV